MKVYIWIFFYLGFLSTAHVFTFTQHEYIICLNRSRSLFFFRYSFYDDCWNISFGRREHVNNDVCMQDIYFSFISRQTMCQQMWCRFNFTNELCIKESILISRESFRHKLYLRGIMMLCSLKQSFKSAVNPSSRSSEKMKNIFLKMFIWLKLESQGMSYLSDFDSKKTWHGLTNRRLTKKRKDWNHYKRMTLLIASIIERTNKRPSAKGLMFYALRIQTQK